MKQFTFWNAKDTHEHLTLRFMENGTILLLSRDAKRSVVPTWKVVGEWSQMRATFLAKVPHLWVAATQLSRKGWDVFGADAKVMLDAKVTSRETGRVTCPDTILGRERKRSTDLGGVNKGEKGARRFGGSRFSFDPNAFHAERMKRMAQRNAK